MVMQAEPTGSGLAVVADTPWRDPSRVAKKRVSILMGG